MDRDEFLQTACSSKFQHRAFSSSKRLVRISRTIVHPSVCALQALAIGLHKHLIQMPLPVRTVPPSQPAFPDLGHKMETEPVRPKPNCFMGFVRAKSVKQANIVRQRGLVTFERSPNIMQCDNICGMLADTIAIYVGGTVFNHQDPGWSFATVGEHDAGSPT